MNKKVLRAGAVSAVAAGVGAAAVMAGKRRSKKEETNSDYRNTELGKFAKNSKGIYYTNAWKEYPYFRGNGCSWRCLRWY